MKNKKSASVLLSAFFIATAASCMMRKEWVDGADEGHNVRDTLLNDKPYRYYRGNWFPVHNDLIRVPYYMSHAQIADTAAHHRIRTGGFGRRANEGVAHS